MGDSLNDVAARACRGFEEWRNRPPEWVVAAPGRVNLIGEHVDYNNGFVLPAAVDRYVVMAAARGEGEQARGSQS